MTEYAAPADLNGDTIPAAATRLPVEDRGGVLPGPGFFETFRTSGGCPHHWRYHRRRLECACATAGLRIPAQFLAADEARVRQAVQHRLRRDGRADAVFRYAIAAGADGGASEFLTPRALPQAAPAEGVRLRVLGLARDDGEFLPRPKSLNDANARLGADELAHRTTVASDEGLFLSRAGGFVAETPRQNIAWLAGGELRHPDPAAGAVAGTCLQWLLEICGLPAAPRRAPLAELLAAEAVFVCNAVRGITPVREILDASDRAVLRTFDSASHPLVRELRAKWEESLRATAAG